MAELVYALGLGSSEATHEGSSPFIDTMHYRNYSTIHSNYRVYEPVILQCPFAEEINPGLMEWIKRDATAIIDDGEARRTGMRPYQMEIPCEELKTLLDWIDSEKLECAEDIAQATNSAYYSSPPQCKNFYIADYWGMWYNKNAHARYHNHYPYAMSFAYYVNCPEGSSPLVLEGNELQVTEGRLIVFAGHMNHQVDPCPVDNRFMIAGNIAYTGFMRV